MEAVVLARLNEHYLRRAATMAGIFLLLHLIWILPLPLALRGVGAQALLLAPGLLFGLLLTRPGSDLLERGFVALCCGVAMQVPLLLALHAMPGGLSWWRVLLPFDLLSLVMAWLLLRERVEQRGNPHRVARWELIVALGVLLLGAAFRLPFLGSAELQGDEANPMLMAVEAVNGRSDILLWHTKGPAEVLLPLGPLALLDSTSEFVARLPFALAGITVLLGVIVLGRRLASNTQAGTVIGAVAAAILALDGFLIAFSRIVQYQNIVALMSLGAVWCCWRFFTGAPRPFWHLALAAALLSVGFLAHYDAVFAVPVGAALVVAGGWRRRWKAREWLVGLSVPLLVGLVLLASFYVPFALHERFQRTLSYLGSRVG